MTNRLPTFTTTSFGIAHVSFGKYRNNALAVELLDDDGGLITTLSVNLVEESPLLAENEFAVKYWSENDELADDALASRLFEDTGRRLGFLRAPVWRVIQRDTPPHNTGEFKAKEYVKREGSNADGWICLCKNHSDDYGCDPCDAQGSLVEPVAGWLGLYVCNYCGRIIDGKTLEVIGRRTKTTETSNQLGI